ITIIHQHSPSPLNPFGVKGVGEGGPIAPPAVIANAVGGALRPFKAEFNRTPVTPQQIDQAVRAASGARYQAAASPNGGASPSRARPSGANPNSRSAAVHTGRPHTGRGATSNDTGRTPRPHARRCRFAVPRPMPVR